MRGFSDDFNGGTMGVAVMGIMRHRFLWPDALPDANPPLSRLGTGWGVPEGKSSDGVHHFCHSSL